MSGGKSGSSQSMHTQRAAANIREIGNKATSTPTPKGAPWSAKPGKGPGSKSGK